MHKPEGLREKKRREVRERISNVATRLFAERGFDAVSVEEVARAAEVSKATVFNHFECKEDLLLDRSPLMMEHLKGALAGVPKGKIVRALRDALIELIDRGDPLSGAVSAIKWFLPLVMSTPSLRARAQQHGQEFEAELATALVAAGLGKKEGPLIAAMAGAAWGYAWRQAVEQVQAGRSLKRIRAEQRATIERAFVALEAGFG
ncbi:MAG TPA: helix-turn-helix domain-containing protein [Bryobacteraceae bacterium]|jgi:AcrR family transcriptional regulator